MKDQSASDNVIINLFKNEKTRQKAFRILISEYKERLYWHIRKIVISHDDTDDVLQNTMIKVWNNMATFKGNSALFTWLYRIATNESLTFINKRKRDNLYNVGDDNFYFERVLENDVNFEGDEIQKKLQLAISKLPEKQKIIFNLKYFEELKYDEISEILDTSVGSLKASYHHAVKKIEAFVTNNL